MRAASCCTWIDSLAPPMRQSKTSAPSQTRDEHMFRDDQLRDDDTRTPRDRSADDRDPFARHLELPDERERQQVGDYRVRASEVRILATVGAFRMVPRDELERCSASPREVERLR